MVQTLYDVIRGCKLCDLRQHCIRPIPGSALLFEPDFKTRMLIVTDYPEAEDEPLNALCSGPAGELMWRVFTEMGWATLISNRTSPVYKTEIRVTTAIKCRPPDKTLTDEHVRKCRPWLADQIRMLGPKVVVMLGNAAIACVTGKALRACHVTRMHGKLEQSKVSGIYTMACVHPRYVIERGHANGGPALNMFKAALLTAWKASHVLVVPPKIQV